MEHYDIEEHKGKATLGAVRAEVVCVRSSAGSGVWCRGGVWRRDERENYLPGRREREMGSDGPSPVAGGVWSYG